MVSIFFSGHLYKAAADLCTLEDNIIRPLDVSRQNTRAKGEFHTGFFAAREECLFIIFLLLKHKKNIDTIWLQIKFGHGEYHLSFSGVFEKKEKYIKEWRKN